MKCDDQIKYDDDDILVNELGNRFASNRSTQTLYINLVRFTVYRVAFFKPND